ncbi:hypothetical protein GF382_00785, partial [Candidatus Falkowbacteria bacterium]|nr:hypothetical protein [Candidatus Falkowbacteria bacterium]
MGKKIKTIFRNPILRSAFFLMLVLVFIFSNFQNRYSEVSASNDKVNIFPSLASRKGNWPEFQELLFDEEPRFSYWQELGNISKKEIGPDGGMSEFLLSNSAFLSVSAQEERVEDEEDEFDISEGLESESSGDGREEEPHFDPVADEQSEDTEDAGQVSEESDIEDAGSENIQSDEEDIQEDSFLQENGTSETEEKQDDISIIEEGGSEEKEGGALKVEEEAADNSISQDPEQTSGAESSDKTEAESVSGSSQEDSSDQSSSDNQDLRESSVQETSGSESSSDSGSSDVSSNELSRGYLADLKLALSSIGAGLADLFKGVDKVSAQEASGTILGIQEREEGEYGIDDASLGSEIMTLKDSLILSGFAPEKKYFGKEIINAQLRLSLAASSSFSNDSILIEYKLGDQWYEAGNLNISQQTSNAKNGGYYLYALPIFSSWENIAGLQVKISYVQDVDLEDDDHFKSAAAEVYLDSAWVEVDFDGGDLDSDKTDTDDDAKDFELKEGEQEYLFFKEKKEEAVKDELLLDGREVDFEHTDENEDETLIIVSDEKKYYGLTEAEVYFSITNIGEMEEDFGLQTFFPEEVGDVESIKKLVRVYEEKESAVYGTMRYHCQSGWYEKLHEASSSTPTSSPAVVSSSTTKSENKVFTCDGFAEEKVCASFEDEGRDCLVHNEYLGTDLSVSYQDVWQSAEIRKGNLKDDRNILEKIFGTGPKRKKVSKDFKAKKSVDKGAYSILPGETQYFKMRIKFPFGSKGEFLIETIGDKGYGLLDPWWNASWDYEREVDIYNGGAALSDFEVKLTFDTASRISAGQMQSDCDDIRFLNSAKG